jgi:branched-chain amino acid transport system permease protein
MPTKAHAFDLKSAVADALATAGIAVLLALPIIGVKTLDLGQATLGLQYRFGWVALAAAAAFAGRLLLTFARSLRTHGRRAAEIELDLDGKAARMARWARSIGLLLAILLPFAPFSDRYVVDVATTVLIYVMLGWGLNIVVGMAGLLDLGYVAFYAVGAYSFALLAHYAGLTFWECLPLAGALAAAFGILLGFPVLRLRGDYLAIVTLGFGEIVRLVLVNWQDVTNGPNGIGNIPRPSFFGLPFSNKPDIPTFAGTFGLKFTPEHRLIFLYFVILALSLIVYGVTERLRRLPIGRAWEALREDETACRSLGINPTNTKLSAFAVGAMFGGFAGAFFAARQGFISPESFTFMESATVLAIVVLGGMGSQIGVVLAAAALVVLPEIGREFAEFRMLAFGAAMVAIMVWRPQGFVARRMPTIRLHSAGA